MIRVACPRCHCKLNAKDELLGEVRDCPQCGHPIQITLIRVPGTSSRPRSTIRGNMPAAEQSAIAHLHVPECLARSNCYLICDNHKLVAAWENNGNSWMLKTNFGMISANRNQDQLPVQGDFKLIELSMRMTDEGVRLRQITSYQLAPHWALLQLIKGDDKVLKTVTGLGHLNKEQKVAVMKFIREHFMREVWENANQVLDYLMNTDYHSAASSAATR